jgi:uncharacterized protein
MPKQRQWKNVSAFRWQGPMIAPQAQAHHAQGHRLSITKAMLGHLLPLAHVPIWNCPRWLMAARVWARLRHWTAICHRHNALLHSQGRGGTGSAPPPKSQERTMQHLPPSTGLGFKPAHFHDIMAHKSAVGFYEVHAENYMGDGGAPHAMLAAIRADHALSLHGVGLSIGSASGLDLAHLARLRKVIARYQPQSFSEHLAWSSHGATWLNDLLPLPYTTQTLTTICAHIDQVQSTLGCRMLLENPATYVSFDSSTWAEADFLTELVRRTGCGLLLDVNNVFVSASNHRYDPLAYLADLPLSAVGEVHLAGHSVDDLPDGPLLIDTHGAPVADPVWALYDWVLARTGPVPSLIEWDTDLPAFDVLLAQAARAQTALDLVRERRDRDAA